MASITTEDLAAAVQRYAEVATTVNRREMTRFIDEIRQRWHPKPPEEWELPRSEGYTDEGVFNLCIYEQAFNDMEPHRDGELTEAELNNEVLLLPSTEGLIDFIPKPLAEPAPQDELNEKLDALKNQLQERSDQTAITDTMAIQLPSEFIKLMSMTNGLNGAGVPSETAETVLVRPLNEHRADIATHESGFNLATSRFYTALAAWEIGGCTQFRQIYYVLCYRIDRNDKETAADARWRIFDHDDMCVDVYDSLTAFVEHETKRVGERPGGAKQVQIIIDCPYPW